MQTVGILLREVGWGYDIMWAGLTFKTSWESKNGGK